MGSEFFWFLDVLVIAITAAFMFRGGRKGAVGVLISSVAAIVAFITAFSFSGIIAENIYDKYIRERIDADMSSKLGSVLDQEIIWGLSMVDMTKAKANEVYIGDIPLEFDDRDKAIIDLSVLDLSETGIENADLKAFGITPGQDSSLIKVGKVSVSRSELKNYGLENVVLAHVITSNPDTCKMFGVFEDVGSTLEDTFSLSLRGLGHDLAAGSRDAMYGLVITIITAAESTPAEAVMNGIITPVVMTPLKVVTFIVIFSVVLLLLNIIANVSKVINRIPIISSVNGFLGVLLGIIEAFIVLFVICTVMKLLISVCGDQLVFLNETTIEKTFIFKYLYSFDPLKLL